jgi:hypothetical protein
LNRLLIDRGTKRKDQKLLHHLLSGWFERFGSAGAGPILLHLQFFVPLCQESFFNGMKKF